MHEVRLDKSEQEEMIPISSVYKGNSTSTGVDLVSDPLRFGPNFAHVFVH